MTIDLYIDDICPFCRVVKVLLLHLNLIDKINVKNVDISANGTRTNEFLKLNPAHSVPVWVEDNGAFVITESRAILQYIVNHFAPGNSLYPSESRARSQVDRILFYDASTYFPSLRAIWIAKKRKQTPTEEQLNEAKEKLQILSKLLGDAEFFANNVVSIADISLGITFSGVKSVLPADSIPVNLAQWFTRLEVAIPEFKKVNDSSQTSVRK